jgi:imidazolonepropionase-like amidohydrolase
MGKLRINRNLLVALFMISSAHADNGEALQQPKGVLFQGVRVFSGKSTGLSGPTDVLVEGNKITKIGTGITLPEGCVAISGQGKTLMPGLIDAHAHVMFAHLTQAQLLTADVGFINLAAAKAAEAFLMMGYTSIRDVGGPVFGVKRAIDLGLYPGPRIYPSGAFVSQTGGHGDFRLPNELPASPTDYSSTERTNGTAIADGVDMVRKRVREQLALGATQIKLMAGGGVSSAYDPLDVTQYSLDELKAAVGAAEDWGTYVTLSMANWRMRQP